MPSFNAIAGYLKSVNYAPHLMWDPWTGRVVQFYGAHESARALANSAGGVETNRMGSHCIQVEVFFSPGAVVGGKRYDSVAQTPCKGLPEIVDWMRSLGIPDVWPLGWPQWSGNSRSASTWQSKGGHYGHCHVPENDHTDPGPMPRDMFKEDDDMPSADELWRHPIAVPDWGKEEHPNAESIPAEAWLRGAEIKIHNTREAVDRANAALAEQGAKLDAILAALTPNEGTS